MDDVKRDEVRAAMTLGNATIAAVSGRNTAYANRTVGDFLNALRQLGVRDEDDLGSIEYGISQFHTAHICVERDEHGAWEVREVPRGEVR